MLGRAHNFKTPRRPPRSNRFADLRRDFVGVVDALLGQAPRLWRALGRGAPRDRLWSKQRRSGFMSMPQTGRAAKRQKCGAPKGRPEGADDRA